MKCARCGAEDAPVASRDLTGRINLCRPCWAAANKPTNVFRIDDESIARLEKWAARSEEGGWQQLCAKILEGRKTVDDLREWKRQIAIRALEKARTLIEDLITAKEANDE